MSYITDIQEIFESYESEGSFGFRADFVQDSKLRNIPKANHPICFIENNTTGLMTPNAGGNMDDTPRITIYFLTRYDSLGNQVSKGAADIDKHSKLVEPMKVLGASVLYEYFKSEDVTKDGNYSLPYDEVIDFMSAWESGVKFTFSLKRNLTTTCP